MIISNIKKIMKEKKIKAQDLYTAGFARGTVTALRTDEGIAECRLSTLSRIAKALGVDVKDLFEEVEEPKEKAPRKESL